MPSVTELTGFLERLAATRLAIESVTVTTPAAGRAARFLRRLEATLARPIRIAVLGEPNSGKTSIVNVLLGHDLLSTDVIENTRVPVLIRYAAVPSIELVERGRRSPLDTSRLRSLHLRAGSSIEVGVALPCLLGQEIVDTPGLSLDQTRDEGTGRWQRTGDVSIWCTLATQAWRATELTLWQSLAASRDASVLAATRADLLSIDDRQKVMSRLASEAGTHFAEIRLVDATKAGSDSDLSACIASIASMARRERLEKARAAVRRIVEELGTERA